MTNSATSHLLPVFARVDLGFERGEGAWLIATDGERYLDFTSGVRFHGRTLGELAGAGFAKLSEGFGPAGDGFGQGAFGGPQGGKEAIGAHTAGILIEPLQGEGGVRAAPHAFFKALRQLCDDNGLLLIFDEVQTGMGRTGELFAYKRIGVTPDVMSLAKALRGGVPIGACLATSEAASGMTPGSHGSTFGGNPLAVAAANAVLDVMLKPGFFEHAQKMSLLLKQKLASAVDRHPDILAEVRGEGLLIGLKAVVPSGDLVTALREQKLLTVGAGENVVRFLPPLIVTEAEIEESVARLERACAALSSS